MDKKLLSKIARPEANEEIINLAERAGWPSFIVTANQLDKDKKLLILNFFKGQDLKLGKLKAEFRTFLSIDDYITQDLTVENIKWKTGGLDNIIGWRWYSPKEIKIIVAYDSDFIIIKNFTEPFIKPDDKNIWEAIYRLQDKIKAARLDTRHKKETDQIDKKMELVTEVTEDFDYWVKETALCRSRYIFYKAKNKDIVTGSCSHCKNTVVINRRETKVENLGKGTCPKCGSEITFRALGKVPGRIQDDKWIMYIQPNEKGFIIRYFHAFINYERGKLLDACGYISEYVREFIHFDEKGEIHKDGYEFTEYKQTGKKRWCHDNDKIQCGLCVLYPKNLPDAWKNTPMKYSALEILSEKMPGEAIHYEWGIGRMQKSPYMEWMIKMGLTRLASDLIESRSHSRLNENGKTIYEILKISKINTKVLVEANGNSDMLRLMQVAQEINLRLPADQLRRYYETFECNTDLLRQSNGFFSLHKIVRYIERESERYPRGGSGCSLNYSYLREKLDPVKERKQNMAHDWLEYLEWCKKLKYDLSNSFNYFPKNFKKVHDRVSKEYQELLDKAAAKEKERQEREAKKRMQKVEAIMAEMFKKNEDNDVFKLNASGLILVIPKSGEDIKKEGQTLHHCVGTYVERVAKGETIILFIRKDSAPNVPYYTMEWKNKKIEQCRGLNNCRMTPEVEAFTKVFEKKMKQYESENKEKKVS